jgi:hypothetical protein
VVNLHHGSTALSVYLNHYRELEQGEKKIEKEKVLKQHFIKEN